MKSRKLIFILLFIVSLVSVYLFQFRPPTSAQDNIERLGIIQAATNLREDSNTSSQIVTTLEAGDVVILLEKISGQSINSGGVLSDDWYRVQLRDCANSLEGYIWSGLVEEGASLPDPVSVDEISIDELVDQAGDYYDTDLLLAMHDELTASYFDPVSHFIKRRNGFCDDFLLSTPNNYQWVQTASIDGSVALGPAHNMTSRANETLPLLDSFQGIDLTQGEPPDPVIAAGPESLILIVNGGIQIRTKEGELITPQISLNDFFRSVLRGGNGDPRVIYDRATKRFFVVAFSVIFLPTCEPGTCISDFLLAVSKSDNPQSLGGDDWHFYTFDATLDNLTPSANQGDATRLGIGQDVVVITSAQIKLADETNAYGKIRILPKSKVLNGEPIRSEDWVDFIAYRDPVDGRLVHAIQPVEFYDGDEDIYFFLSDGGGRCSVTVYIVEDVSTNPRLTSRVAYMDGRCDNPPFAQQPNGQTLSSEGNVTFHSSPTYRNGYIWGTHTVSRNYGTRPVSAVRWFQIDVRNWQQGVQFVQHQIIGQDDIDYFYPSVTTNQAGQTALIMGRSSPKEYISVVYTGRLADDPPNTMRPLALLQTSADSYSGSRWGDYYGIAVDPSDSSVWMLGQYAPEQCWWSTWVGHVGWEMVPSREIVLSPNETQIISNDFDCGLLSGFVGLTPPDEDTTSGTGAVSNPDFETDRQSGEPYITTGTFILNATILYAEPNITADQAICTSTPSTLIAVQRRFDQEWYLVRCPSGNWQGWVLATSFMISSSANDPDNTDIEVEALSAQGQISSPAVQLMSRPMGHTIVTVCSGMVEITGQYEQWYQVICSTGHEGWLPKTDVVIDQP